MVAAPLVLMLLMGIGRDARGSLVFRPDDKLKEAKRFLSADASRFAEKFLQLAVRGRPSKTIERSLLGQLFGGANETAPGRARERAANADSSHPQRRDISHGQTN